MDLTNLKEGRGYITRSDIRSRLCRFDLPEGESFFMRRHEKRPSFSGIGATYEGHFLAFFDVRTTSREVYHCIRDMFFEAVNDLKLPAEAEGWDKDEDRRSNLFPSAVGGVTGGGSAGRDSVAEQC